MAAIVCLLFLTQALRPSEPGDSNESLIQKFESSAKLLPNNLHETMENLPPHVLRVANLLSAENLQNPREAMERYLFEPAEYAEHLEFQHNSCETYLRGAMGVKAFYLESHVNSVVSLAKVHMEDTIEDVACALKETLYSRLDELPERTVSEIIFHLKKQQNSRKIDTVAISPLGMITFQYSNPFYACSKLSKSLRVPAKADEKTIKDITGAVEETLASSPTQQIKRLNHSVEDIEIQQFTQT